MNPTPTGFKGPWTRSKSSKQMARFIKCLDTISEAQRRDDAILLRNLQGCSQAPLRTSYDSEYADFLAFGAKVLNPDGSPLKHRKALNGSDSATWHAANHSEIEKLVDELGAMHFIDDLPPNRRAAYYRPVLEINKHGAPRIRGTYGGDKTDVEYTSYDLASRQANMITKKCFFNSIVSEGLQHWTADIRDFYVNANNKLTTPCYMKISFDQLSPATIMKYNLEQHRSKGFALVEVTSALYGMPEAGRIAQDKLVAILALHGYIEEERSEKMCLFRSTDPNNRTAFIVHTDDFACIWPRTYQYFRQ
jgi:hypothetical protein